MNLKRFTRGPALYIVLALVLVVAVTTGLRGTDYKTTSTAQLLEYINSGQVSTDETPVRNKLLDKEQQVRVVLKNPDKQGRTKFQASFLVDQGRDFAAAFDKNDIPYDVKVSRESLFVS